MHAEQHAFDIEVAQRHRHLALDSALIEQVVVAALKQEQVTSAEISVAFVDDAEIQRINREFLRHDHPTDVISFPLQPADGPAAESSGPARRIEGELVVSLDTARRVAESHGWSLEAEVILYVVHGLLHLCGHDDQTASARSAMRCREREILSTLGWTGVEGNPASQGWDDGLS